MRPICHTAGHAVSKWGVLLYHYAAGRGSCTRRAMPDRICFVLGGQGYHQRVAGIIGGVSHSTGTDSLSVGKKNSSSMPTTGIGAENRSRESQTVDCRMSFISSPPVICIISAFRRKRNHPYRNICCDNVAVPERCSRNSVKISDSGSETGSDVVQYSVTHRSFPFYGIDRSFDQ